MESSAVGVVAVKPFSFLARHAVRPIYPSPEELKPFVSAVDVVLSAEELEAVELRHGALAGNDRASQAVELAEIRITSRDHTPYQCPVGWVVEEDDVGLDP